MFTPPPLPRNVEAAFRDLGSTKMDIRAGAARDVVRHALGDESLRARAIAVLETALDDPAPIVRSAAVLGLGELEAGDALPKLLLRVEDEDANVRQMALTALGELGDERALPRLRRALGDARPEVRYQAVIAVARLASCAEVTSSLVTALGDTDDNVRYIALRIGEERMVEADCAEDRAAFAPLVDAARALLQGAPPRLAAAAAILAARAGDEAARKIILRIAAGDFAAEKEDEQEAVELTGELDLREAIPALEKRAYGAARFVRDTCTFHAKIALARLGHERARNDIERDLSARNRSTRDAAVVAAGRARLSALASTIASLSEGQVDPHLRAEALSLLGPASNASASRASS